MIETNMKTIEEKGFINYFGMQRFGAYNIKTHEIGKSVINGDYRKAVH